MDGSGDGVKINEYLKCLYWNQRELLGLEAGKRGESCGSHKYKPKLERGEACPQIHHIILDDRQVINFFLSEQLPSDYPEFLDGVQFYQVDITVHKVNYGLDWYRSPFAWVRGSLWYGLFFYNEKECKNVAILSVLHRILVMPKLIIKEKKTLWGWSQKRVGNTKLRNDDYPWIHFVKWLIALEFNLTSWCIVRQFGPKIFLTYIHLIFQFFHYITLQCVHLSYFEF